MSYGSGEYTYELVDGWAKLPKGVSFLDVGGIAIDPEDNVYVLNRSEHPVMVFDSNGNLLRTWGEGFFGRAHGSCMGPDNSIYCTDDVHHTVTKFTPDGEVVMMLGERGRSSDTGYVHTVSLWERLGTIVRGAPPFNRPTGVSIGPKGDIYVADGYGNARVHKFSADGRLLLSWGEPGVKPGQFLLPHSVRVDRQDRVWVADRENHRIQIFDSNGGFIDQLTGLIRPTDLFVDDDKGVVYVPELAMRVSILTLDGNLIARWGNAGTESDNPLFIAPHAVAVDSRGDLYVGEVAMTGWQIDRGPRAIQKFARMAWQ